MLEHFVSRMDNSGLTNELQEETDHPSDQQEKRGKERARLFHFLLLIRLPCSWMLLLCVRALILIVRVGKRKG